MRNSFTVSVMFSSKPQFSGAFLNTTPHLAKLLSHHFLLYPPCYLREMSEFFLHEPVNGRRIKMTQERFQSIFKTICCALHQGVYNSDMYWLKNISKTINHKLAAKPTQHLQHLLLLFHFRWVSKSMLLFSRVQLWMFWCTLTVPWNSTQRGTSSVTDTHCTCIRACQLRLHSIFMCLCSNQVWIQFVQGCHRIFALQSGD